MSFDLIERLKVSHLDWCERNAPGHDPAEIRSVMAEAAAELTLLRADNAAQEKTISGLQKCLSGGVLSKNDARALLSGVAAKDAELTHLRAKVEAADKLAEAVEGQENREMCGCDGPRCRDCIRRDDALNAALSAYDGEKG